MHTFLSDRVRHAAPLLRGCTVTALVRLATPVAEGEPVGGSQFDWASQVHADQVSTWQSTGHELYVHAWDS